MILVFIGPPGSGKGTQAKIISKRLSIPHISTGEILRNSKEKTKREIEKITKKGGLINNKLMFNLLNRRIKQKDCEQGFILDGYPRNLKQAKKLDKKIGFDKIIEIETSEKVSIKRILGRRHCCGCGKKYNIKIKELRPKNKEYCDLCGKELVKRKDDNEKTIKKRLKIYNKITKPLIKEYKNRVIKINGNHSIKKVANQIIKELKDEKLI
ncbi:MAG TPA: nucleoside monophosphate kinase [Candidatus Nanoarchaeia archaeon]|nr:nucleoside monophosphate kinase [Candidatus Nanoarchaeia archaeon]